jgi:hypothetical protein
MKTDDLIRALSADLGPRPRSLGSRFAAMILPGFLLAVALFLVVLGPRPDIAAMAGDLRFTFKFVVTLSLVAFSAPLALQLVRPGAQTRARLLAVATVPAILLVGVAMELTSSPPSLWMMKLIGSNAVHCLMTIPLLALPILVAALIALREGAPTRPALAGLVAGLVAGGLGAAVYAAHCPDDSPLFVATWYSISIAFVATVGGISGRWVLRW